MNAPEGDPQFSNCIVRCIADQFQHRVTMRSAGLTKARCMALKQFDVKVASMGCTKGDVFALETALKIKLMKVDALGHTM